MDATNGHQAALPLLWHILISHYSEKVRWAIDLKRLPHARRAPVPGFHVPLALWLTRGRGFTLPVLELDGEILGDSTAIIAALEQRVPDPPLYPADPDERRRALELEDWFDEELGPYIRRVGFYEMRRDPERFAAVTGGTVPTLARLGRAGVAIGRAFTAVRYSASSTEGAEAARAKVVAAVDRLEAELGDGDYLVGDTFTVADLTAAALFYPLVLPPEASSGVRELAPAFEEFAEPLRARRGGQWVAEMFRRHRQAARVPVPVG